MSEEILKRLDALATTLGTTAEYLVETLSRGAFAGALWSVVVCAFGFAMVGGGIWSMRCGYRYKPKPNDYADDTQFHFWFGGILITVVGAFIALTAGHTAVVGIIAPDAVAIREIFEAISK